MHASVNYHVTIIQNIKYITSLRWLPQYQHIIVLLGTCLCCAGILVLTFICYIRVDKKKKILDSIDKQLICWRQLLCLRMHINITRIKYNALINRNAIPSLLSKCFFCCTRVLAWKRSFVEQRLE